MHHLGIDVAKAKLDCCLLVGIEKNKTKSKSVKNSPEGIADLLTWITKQNILHTDVQVVVEATGVYHEQAATQLHEAGITVVVANPAQVKYFARGLAVRTKTDAVDSHLLARYSALAQPQRWTPPPPQALILKGLLARRSALEQDLQREKNRQESMEIAQRSPLILQSLSESICFIIKQLKKIQSQIDDHIDNNPSFKNDLELMKSIPGIGDKTGSQLLTIMHSNTFHSAEQLSAYLGLVPVEHQSGTSVKGRAKLSKAGPARVRAVLYMAAVVAIKYNPHVKALYTRLLARGKSKMSALGACMRKLAHLCYGVLKTQKNYQAEYKNA